MLRRFNRQAKQNESLRALQIELTLLEVVTGFSGPNDPDTHKCKSTGI